MARISFGFLRQAIATLRRRDGCGSLLRFVCSRAGNVAITFGITLLPVAGLVGAAVDYSRANNVLVGLQGAVDSTALAMAQSASNQTASQLQTNAANYFSAIFHRADAQNTTLSISYTNTNGTQVIVTGSASVPTAFLGIIGFRSIPVSATSTVNWSNSRLRVALVLDNTGSMADSGKMTALKTAAHNLLTQLKNAANNAADVYVSIIPFTTDVNIGTSFVNASWIDWSNYSPNGSIEDNMTCSSGGWWWGGWGTQQCGQHNTDQWNGCVMDRAQDYDISNAVPTSTNSNTFVPADQSSWCPAQITPLTNDWTALNNAIDAMQPNGNTNQTIGLAWGWMSFTSGGPFTVPAMDANYTYQNVIILLTDGMNTENRWTSTQSQIDARTQKVCSAIKTANITIYTVLVLAGNSTILQNCATDSTKYFALSSSSEIITTFAAIGTKLSQLHIAK